MFKTKSDNISGSVFWSFEYWDFEFVSDFDIRISNLAFTAPW